MRCYNEVNHLFDNVSIFDLFFWNFARIRIQSIHLIAYYRKDTVIYLLDLVEAQ